MIQPLDHMTNAAFTLLRMSAASCHRDYKQGPSAQDQEQRGTAASSLRIIQSLVHITNTALKTLEDS